MKSTSAYGGLDWIDPDPYCQLRRRHKLPYTYSFETDFFGNEFLVRLCPRNLFFNFADPDFLATDEKNIELWRGAEFEVDEKPPEQSIATKYNILDAFRKNRCGYVDFDWVSIDVKISEKQSIDLVLEGAIDRFNEFGLQSKRKAHVSESCQKRRRLSLEHNKRLLHEELSRLICSPRLE